MSSTSFDDRAATWDDAANIERANAIAKAISSAIPLSTAMRMLEYGAGTGLVTQALRDHVGPVTLADTSAGMRKVMQEKIASGLLSEARVWDTDLSGTQLPDERFEIIVTVMVLHHVADTDGMLANFARLLEAGGYLCIVDLDTEDGSFHGAGFEGHRGFDRHDLARRLRAVGFSEVVIEDCYVLQKDGGDFPLFLATARRPDLIAAG